MSIMIIVSGAAMQRWTVQVCEDEATFSGAPEVEDHTAVQALPRVWAGRGLGLAKDDLHGFTAALAEVMKTHLYQSAWGRHGMRAGGGRGEVWSIPRRDDDDGFVYVSGPCGKWSGQVGYRPAATFTMWLPDVRGLRIRLAAYLASDTRLHS
jgi:hypothetical protein